MSGTCRDSRRTAHVVLVLLLAAHAEFASGRRFLEKPGAALMRLLKGGEMQTPAPPPLPGGSVRQQVLEGTAVLPWRASWGTGRLDLRIVGGDIEPVDEHIIGGEPAPESDFGFVAALVSRQDNATRFCGGAMLDAATVLTAAHCVVDPESGRPIHPLSLWVEVRGELYPPMLILPHPAYNPGTLEADEQTGVARGGLHDIAAIKLAVPAEDPDTVLLPGRRRRLRDGQMLEVAGFGQTSNAKNESGVLLFAEVQYIARAVDCPILPFNDTICAGNEETGARTCRGDSGSPLVVRNETTGEAVVVGVAAFSPTNCTTALPYSRFTDVRKYANNIREWLSV